MNSNPISIGRNVFFYDHKYMGCCMNNNPLMDYSSNLTERTYKIAGDLELHVTVTSNPHNIPLDALFAMAARINKKRSFLFVSKVLGKHIPVNPYTSLLSG